MIKHSIKHLLRRFGFELVSSRSLTSLQDKINSIPTSILVYLSLDNASRGCIAKYLPLSSSQIGQDIFVLSQLQGDLTNKYFVEVGGMDGIIHSNSYFLEKHLGWKGIIVEPGEKWKDKLQNNRSCIVDTRCVTSKTGDTVDFLEVEAGSGLSSIKEYADEGDWGSQIRLDKSTEYRVETVSLADLFLQHNAPNEITYLSIDTEGSEFDILKSFDFSSRRIRIITVEHNFIKQKRLAIESLLNGAGYRKTLSDISQFDDWYVLDE